MTQAPTGEGSLVFILHLRFDGITDKTVQTLALAGGEIFDDLPLAFFDDHIDAIVGFFVISGSGFLLRVVILRMFQKITSNIY